MSEIIIAVVSVAGIGLGVAVGYFLRKQIAQARTNSIEAIAEKRLVDVKNKEQELLLNAKEKAIKIIDEAKNEEQSRRHEIKKSQERVEQRENMFDKKLMEFEDRKTKLQQKVEEIQAIKEKIDRAKEQVDEKLQTVAGYTKEQAKEELFKKIEANSQDDLMARVLKFEKANEEKLEEKLETIARKGLMNYKGFRTFFVLLSIFLFLSGKKVKNVGMPCTILLPALTLRT